MLLKQGMQIAKEKIEIARPINLIIAHAAHLLANAIDHISDNNSYLILTAKYNETTNPIWKQ